MIRIFAPLFFCLSILTAYAAVDTWQFDDVEKQARFIDLTEELRCPKCQNQNLADSDAPIANDLRAQIYRLLNEGKSDEEIKDWLVERYGDYVLYRPAWSARTLLLWSAPFVLLAVGVIIVLMMVRRRNLEVEKSDATTLDQSDRERLKNLLDDMQPHD